MQYKSSADILDNKRQWGGDIIDNIEIILTIHTVQQIFISLHRGRGLHTVTFLPPLKG